MASSLTFFRVVTVLSFSIVLLLQGCSSLRWAGGYAGENYQITPVYDPNEMPIDSSSYYYHTVQPGETLGSIAQRYGRTWRDLATRNNLSTPYTLEIGRKLLVTGAGNVTAYLIPPAPVVSPSRRISAQSIPKPTASSGEYVVQPGDTVYSLSRRSGYTVSQLMSWNGLTSSQSLRVGQRFWLSPPGTGSSSMTMQRMALPATTSAPPARNSSNYHVVVGGDTVYNVARRYGNTPDQIIAWNGLTPPYRLTIGSTLRIDGTTSSQKRIFNYPAPPVKSGSRYHTVTRGQTVYRIAKMYGCSEYELMVNNRLSKPILREGQQFDVSCANRRSDATPYQSSLVAQSLPSAGNLRFHKVKTGETLETIAKMYGISSHELALSNGIGSPYSLYPGQPLKITSR